MHTTPWFHATDIPNVPPQNLVQIGIGGWQAPRPGVRVGRERGTTIMTVTDCVEMGVEAAAQRALQVAWDGTDAVWLSFDVDCLDAAFVPGTGWPEPGGFLPREVLRFIQLVAARPLAGIEVVECSPALRQRRDHRAHRDPGHLRHPRLPGARRSPPAKGSAMTTQVRNTDPTGGPDADDLRSIGYRQELHRRLGAFSSFAAGFSFVSILTTVFQLFALGHSFGGPAFFWTWPLVFAGQLCVALVFAELAVSWPLAGCIYQWSRRLAGETVGWFAGWAMLVGYIVSVAAIGIALQAVLPAVWSGFQVIGTDPSITSASGAANGILLGSVLIALATVISAVGVRFMALINGIGVTCELVGVVLLLVLLFSHAHRAPSVVTKTLQRVRS